MEERLGGLEDTPSALPRAAISRLSPAGGIPAAWLSGAVPCGCPEGSPAEGTPPRQPGLVLCDSAGLWFRVLGR